MAVSLALVGKKNVFNYRAYCRKWILSETKFQKLEIKIKISTIQFFSEIRPNYGSCEKTPTTNLMS